MIFGISVSDIYGCAHLAYRIYVEFNQAPGACQEFARDLLLFYEVLRKTGSAIDSSTSHLDDSDGAALRRCLDSCKELLCVHIIGAQKVPEDLTNAGFNLCYPLLDSSWYGRPVFKGQVFQTWRYKFHQRRLALRIPKLQRAISAHIEKLNVLLILYVFMIDGLRLFAADLSNFRSNRCENQESQERIEKRVVESHDLLAESLTDNGLRLDSISDCLDTSHDLLAQFSTDHAVQLDSVAERLDTSQARIESQLQAILANQQRSRTPILSQTLDASSPEGRQTWMELGRLLRDEGIPPAVIQSNRGLLIDAIKNTLRNETLLAESASESYATAPEHHTDSIAPSSGSGQRDLSSLGHSPILPPMSVLGSAPPSSSGFTDAFLARQTGAASSLDKDQNVNDGMQSLLQGMSDGDLTEESELGDSDYFESGDIELDGHHTPYKYYLAESGRRRDYAAERRSRLVTEQLVAKPFNPSDNVDNGIGSTLWMDGPDGGSLGGDSPKVLGWDRARRRIGLDLGLDGHDQSGGQLEDQWKDKGERDEEISDEQKVQSRDV